MILSAPVSFSSYDRKKNGVSNKGVAEAVGGSCARRLVF